MPATYQELLTETLPAIIENDEEYGEIHSRLGRLIGKGRSRTPEETKLMRLLGLLVQDYDARHGMPREESTAEERLQFLLEHSGKTSADLLPFSASAATCTKPSRASGRSAPPRPANWERCSA